MFAILHVKLRLAHTLIVTFITVHISTLGRDFWMTTAGSRVKDHSMSSEYWVRISESVVVKAVQKYPHTFLCKKICLLKWKQIKYDVWMTNATTYYSLLEMESFYCKRLKQASKAQVNKQCEFLVLHDNCLPKQMEQKYCDYPSRFVDVGIRWIRITYVYKTYLSKALNKWTNLFSHFTSKF